MFRQDKMLSHIIRLLRKKGYRTQIDPFSYGPILCPVPVIETLCEIDDGLIDWIKWAIGEQYPPAVITAHHDKERKVLYFSSPQFKDDLLRIEVIKHM